MKYFGNITLSVIAYFVLQFIGSLIEFGIFGSGSALDGKELYIPIGMVVFHVLLTLIIKLKTSLFYNNVLFIICLIIPIGLFSYFYW